MSSPRPVVPEARSQLLEVAVAGARIRRLQGELALARRERNDAITEALTAGALQVQVAETLRVDRRTVWEIVRGLS